MRVRTRWRLREGTSLVEVLVSLLLTALLAQIGWWVAISARRSADRLTAQSEALETGRIGWRAIEGELSGGVMGRDWSVSSSGQVLSLRAFRGVGEFCRGLSGPDGGVVRYRGRRLPEPAKDSLLVLGESGQWSVVKLTSRTSVATACPGWGAGDVLERWRWEPTIETPLLGRVFERGTYHLEDESVRYRVGAGGRQPLTPERLDPLRSGFADRSGGLLQLRMGLWINDSVTWEWAALLPTEGGGG
jgi:hypothetical protein